MRFLIDGSGKRLAERIAQWSDGVAGQLLTPLTRYKRAHEVFAIDNGAYGGFRQSPFCATLKRNSDKMEECLFVCVPDKLGDHKTTLQMWHEKNHLADGWKKAFVAQDGYDGMPEEADAIFIGGTNAFKDSLEAIYAIIDARAKGKHVHIGRINGPERFHRFREYADTCDGSGVSKYDHMLIKIKESCE